MGDCSDWPAPPAPRWADAAAAGALRPQARITRRRLLLAASRLVADRGYKGASLTEIAEDCGLSKGAVYFHFASKRALAEALVAEVFASWDDIMARIERRGLDPLRTLLVLYDAYGARLMHDISARAALRIVREDVARHHAQRWTLTWEETVEALLRRASADGSLRTGIDPGWLSRHVLATAIGNFQIAEGKSDGPTLWERMDDTWAGLLPAVAAPGWLAAWRSSGWSTRPQPSPDRYRRRVEVRAEHEVPPGTSEEEPGRSDELS